MTSHMTQTEPLIIAHRGATAYAPENSYEAIEKAIELLEGHSDIQVLKASSYYETEPIGIQIKNGLLIFH